MALEGNPADGSTGRGSIEVDQKNGGSFGYGARHGAEPGRFSGDYRAWQERTKSNLVLPKHLPMRGAVNQRQTGRQHYYEYTLKGGRGRNVASRFSYYGFRYIQVEGAVLKGQKKNPQKLPVIKTYSHALFITRLVM